MASQRPVWAVCSKRVAVIEAGLDAGERELVAVPGRRITHMRRALGAAGANVEFWNMHLLGPNAGRIIPALGEWIGDSTDSRCRLISEAVWPGRTRAEIVEAIRNEALINLAFSGVPATILCPYHAGGLARDVVADVGRAFPELAAA